MTTQTDIEVIRKRWKHTISSTMLFEHQGLNAKRDIDALLARIDELVAARDATEIEPYKSLVERIRKQGEELARVRVVESA